MRLNIYDIIFYQFYDIFKRQGNSSENDNKLDGVVGGSITFSIFPLILFLDIMLILENNHIKIFEIDKTLIVVFMLVTIGLNFLYFFSNKRYKQIDNIVRTKNKKEKVKYSLTTWMFVATIIIGFFSLL